MKTFQSLATGVCRLAFVVLIFLGPATGQAQNSVWDHVFTKDSGLAAKGPNLTSQLSLLPERYRLYRLDESTLQSQLLQAGAAASGAIASKGLNPTTISVPFPDGDLVELNITPTTMMEPTLAAANQGLLTYKAVATRDPRIRGVLDYTSKGFHGLISTPSGMVYLDPRGNAFDRYYVSYYQGDYAPTGKTGVASCGLKGESQGIIGSNKYYYF